MTIAAGYAHCLQALQPEYEQSEAIQLSHLLLEHITGLSKMERILQKDNLLTTEQEKMITKSLHQLLVHTPIQYVTGEAWFCGLKLMVNGDVLIPRPETEELLQWILEENNYRQPAIIDAGTGSGCIAIALKKNIPGAEIYALDISKNALKLAKKNAVSHGVNIHFLLKDILDISSCADMPAMDIIVSNPPYVTENEKAGLDKNVINFEPHLALFVPDNDPLVYYKAIIHLAKLSLKKKGRIYAEINESLYHTATELFEQSGFTDIVVRKDIYGKHRMIKAVQP